MGCPYKGGGTPATSEQDCSDTGILYVVAEATIENLLPFEGAQKASRIINQWKSDIV